MSLVSVTPAAGRIAEIRSAISGFTATAARSSTNGRPSSEVFSVALGAALDAEESTPTSARASLPSTAVVGTAPAAGSATAPPFVVVDADVPYADLFNDAGRRHDVSPALLAAVAEVESGFDPTAISPVGAGGLMQFMPATAAEMGVDPFQPASAVDGAARYLARDLERFGRLDLAVAAYNAGPGAVAEHNGIPPYPETQQYVRKVLTVMESSLMERQV